ncbi:pyridoxal phosphate-dependent aminotransferase [Butyrivibrio sp. VCD2006]|uniref:pyridoxal phosphate-dependent aminotransferase n=1 Tax=Butyrivibrio sp. VCD2006 TaxID=1280664 RepID=UPI0003F84E58|nr:pyridoxal phosphate-dependent aminotransferase [Butyrivibrio sp. VCD2006]
MSTTLSNRMATVKMSPTTALFTKVEELKCKGEDIVSLNVGEPDFPTPDNIKEAGIKAINENFTRYTTGNGIAPLREAIIEKMKKDNGVTYEMNEVAVMVGAKQSLFCALCAVAGEGDEVIIPYPCYVSYPDIVTLAGAKPVLVKRNDDFSLDLEAIENAVTEHTKAVIICTPDNPTGKVYSEDDLRGLSDLAKAKDFFVISDEIYEKIIYGENRHISISSFEGMKDRTVVVNGFSKTYSMTGWRLGYLCARADVIGAAVKVQSQTTTTPPSISQYAAVEALRGPQDSVELMRSEFEKRRDYVQEKLRDIPGVVCHDIQGAFYAFFDIREFLGKEYEGYGLIENDSQFCEYLLEKYHVAMMPGSAYFAPGFVRISFASSMEVLKMATQRIALGLNAHKC